MAMALDEERRRQRELDAVLDAALDELDGDSDDESDAGGNLSAAAAAESGPRKNVAAPVGVGGDGVESSRRGAPETMVGPYSREYLAGDQRTRAEEAPLTSSASSRPRFGPEPPPPNPMAADHPPDLAGGEAELAASLEGMMRQFTEALGDGGGGGGDAEGAMEDMFRQMMMGEGSAPSASSSNGGATNNTAPDQSSANSTTAPGKGNGTNNNAEPDVDESVNRLLDGINRASHAPLPPNGLPPGMPDIDPAQFEKLGEEMMQSLMGEFEKMGAAEDSNDVVDGVMKQLLDKDLMYEPMKEVCARFPKWLAENKEGLSEEEYRRYGTQYQYFQRIVHVYETEPNNFARLMELMQDIQEYGQPPVEIIKDLAPELEFDQEGMPIMDPTGMMGGGGMPGMPGMPPGMPFPGGEGCCIS